MSLSGLPASSRFSPFSGGPISSLSLCLPSTPTFTCVAEMRPSLQKVLLWKFAGQRRYNTVSACFMFLFLVYPFLRCVRHKLSSFPCVCPSPPMMGLFSLFPGLEIGPLSQVTCLIRNYCNFLPASTLTQVCTQGTVSGAGGGASFALECGLPTEVIQAQGDWASNAYQLYVTPTLRLRRKLATVLRERICNL